MEIIGETKNMMLKLLILAVVLCFFSLLSSMRAEAQDTAENVVFVQSRTTQPVSLPAMIGWQPMMLLYLASFMIASRYMMQN